MHCPNKVTGISLETQHLISWDLTVSQYRTDEYTPSIKAWKYLCKHQKTW